MTLGKLALFVSLAVKTKVYAAIIKMISRIAPCIMTMVILFSPLFLFVLLVIICNGICNVDIYSEDTIRVGLIVLLGIFYYVSIYLMSNNFVCQVVDYYNRTCNAELKTWKYKLMTYFPFLNMCAACSLNEEVKNMKNEK